MTTTNADIKIYAEVDEACLHQLSAICSSPAFENAIVRVMPDAHSGVNSVVGFTASIGDKIIPNIVSGDIGCGVLAVRLRKPKKGLDFTKLDKVIRSAVPFGVGSIHTTPIADFPYEELLCWGDLPNKHVIPNSLGSLGAGNHFIEIDKASSGDSWLVIHSGSRNLGTKIAEYYQGLAGKRIGNEIPSDISYSMAWLEGEQKDAYLHDMKLACDFASRNRLEIARIVMKDCGFKEVDRIESIHNYIDIEDEILRKGAIAARCEEMCIIPMNMARGCIIAKGLGNADWNQSAPHGAGRAMTRKAARESIAMSDYKNAMKGVWSSCVAADTVDESPAAYKEPDDVISRMLETVEIEEEMKAIYNFKAPGDK